MVFCRTRFGQTLSRLFCLSCSFMSLMDMTAALAFSSTQFAVRHLCRCKDPLCCPWLGMQNEGITHRRVELIELNRHRLQ